MLIATYNVNGINRRFESFNYWLRSREPEVVCLQELKCSSSDFPATKLKALGYEAVWHGERSWNGVAILSRVGIPVLTRIGLPGDTADRQARYIEAAVNGVLVASLYAPNGNPQPGPKFNYKLAWMSRLARRATTLRRTGAPVVLAGDFNVAPTTLDIYDERSWRDDALIQPQPRAAFRRLLGRSWTDAIRHLNPERRIYTFWSYFRNRWPRDAGLRLDHLLLSPNLLPSLTQVGVDREVRAQPDASDHAPAWLRLDMKPSDRPN